MFLFPSAPVVVCLSSENAGTYSIPHSYVIIVLTSPAPAIRERLSLSRASACFAYSLRSNTAEDSPFADRLPENAINSATERKIPSMMYSMCLTDFSF